MRKLLVAVFIPIILCVTLFSFCGCEKKYKLTIDGDETVLVEPLKKSYAAGETVTVKVGIILDAAVVVKFNGTTLPQKLASVDGRYSHYECTFTMPEENSTLELTITDGMHLW